MSLAICRVVLACMIISCEGLSRPPLLQPQGGTRLSTSAITFRAASVADMATVAALVTELNLADGYAISASEDALREVLFEGSRVRMHCLLAEWQGAVQGLALYYVGYDTVSATYGYHLADIVVAEAYRGRGIGTALFRELTMQILAEKGEWISLTVLKKNKRALQFYQRQGMVEVAVHFMAIGPQGLKKCAQRELNLATR